MKNLIVKTIRGERKQAFICLAVVQWEISADVCMHVFGCAGPVYGTWHLVP